MDGPQHVALAALAAIPPLHQLPAQQQQRQMGACTVGWGSTGSSTALLRADSLKLSCNCLTAYACSRCASSIRQATTGIGTTTGGTSGLACRLLTRGTGILRRCCGRGWRIPPAHPPFSASPLLLAPRGRIRQAAGHKRHTSALAACARTPAGCGSRWPSPAEQGQGTTEALL